MCALIASNSPGITAQRAGWGSAIHALSPCENAHFHEHLVRLSGECRRSRFGNPASDTFLREYAARVDFANTRVFGCFEEGQMHGAAELRSLHSQWCSEAELAFSVEKDWQGRGVGTALAAEAIRSARELGVEHLHLSCNAFNRRMQRIAARFEAKIRFEEGECFADIAVRWQPVAPVLGDGPDGAQALRGVLTLDLGEVAS